MVDPPCPERTSAKSDRRLGPASLQLLPGGRLRGFCYFLTQLLFWLVTYISNVPWIMLLKTCGCADYQSDSARRDLKIRPNFPCLNKNFSKWQESEPSQFPSVKAQFYSQESFCLWSRVMLTGEASKGKGGVSPHPVGCVLAGTDNFKIFF